MESPKPSTVVIVAVTPRVLACIPLPNTEALASLTMFLPLVVVVPPPAGPPVVTGMAQVSPPGTPAPSDGRRVHFPPGPMLRSGPHTSYDFRDMGAREGDSTAGGHLAASQPDSFWSFLGNDYGPSVKGRGR